MATANYDYSGGMGGNQDRPGDQIDFEFFLQNYCRHANEKGSLYTWGSGEMGQLGYSSRIIGQMPKDRDGYPFQVSSLPHKNQSNSQVSKVAN